MRVRDRLVRLLPTVRFVRVGDDSDLSDSDRAEWEADRVPRSTFENVLAPEAVGPFTCPCCGQRTLPSRGGYDLCAECRWEDDGQDDHDRTVVRRGPDGPISLDTARKQYRAAGGRP